MLEITKPAFVCRDSYKPRSFQCPSTPPQLGSNLLGLSFPFSIGICWPVPGPSCHESCSLREHHDLVGQPLPSQGGGRVSIPRSCLQGPWDPPAPADPFSQQFRDPLSSRSSGTNLGLSTVLDMTFFWIIHLTNIDGHRMPGRVVADGGLEMTHSSRTVIQGGGWWGDRAGGKREQRAGQLGARGCRRGHSKAWRGVGRGGGPGLLAKVVEGGCNLPAKMERNEDRAFPR